jgi:hypothetical protein
VSSLRSPTIGGDINLAVKRTSLWRMDGCWQCLSHILPHQHLHKMITKHSE